MRAERRGRGVRNGRVGQPLLWEELTRRSAAGHGCMDVTSRVRRKVYARFCERQGVRLPLPTRRTHSWMNAFGKLRRCTEKVRSVVDFYLFLVAALVVLRQLI